jgi:hypothetical protein
MMTENNNNLSRRAVLSAGVVLPLIAATGTAIAG